MAGSTLPRLFRASRSPRSTTPTRAPRSFIRAFRAWSATTSSRSGSARRGPFSSSRPIKRCSASTCSIRDCDGTRSEAQFQAISFSRSGTGKPQTIIRSGTVDGDQNLISGTFDNVDLRTQSRFDVLKTDFYQATASLDQKFGDSLRFVGNFGYGNSAFRNPVQTTVTIDASNTANFFYDFSTRFPALRPGVDITKSSSFAFVNGTSEVRIRPQTVDNDFTNAKGYLEWTVSPLVKVKGGVDWRRFGYNSTEDRRLQGETVVQTLTAAQLASATKLFSGFGKGLNIPDGTPTAWIVPDLDAFTGLGIYSNPLYAIGGVENATARGSFITVREEDLGVWGMAEFDLDDLGFPLRGDIGVRHVSTDQISTGYASQGATVNLVTADRSYDRWLPSGNLVFDVTDNLLLRFGAAKTLARAGIASMTPGGNLNVSGGNRSFSSGNPDLKPTSSTNLDFAAEWYPTRGAIYAVAIFQKDIGTFVQTLSAQVPFSALGLPGLAAHRHDRVTDRQLHRLPAGQFERWPAAGPSKSISSSPSRSCPASCATSACWPTTPM